MFDFVRSHQRLMLGFVLLLIFPAFAFFGVSGYEQMMGGRDDVAVVDGTRISRASLDEAHRQQLDRMREMFGDQMDVRLFDTPQARSQVLESLITQQALLADAARRHVAVQPADVQKRILATEMFQTDGKFDFSLYERMLAQNQRTPRMFEAEVAQELRMQVVLGAIQQSAVAPKSVVSRVFEAQESRRTIRTRTIDPKALEAGLKPTDEQLRKYFDEHAERYRQAESADIEYLVLERAKLKPAGLPSEAELRGYYDQNKGQFAQGEARRASHILVAVPAGADAAAREAARTKAEGLLEAVRKEPSRFAELAKANSDDPGSAGQGGDLGFFERDMMVKPFSDAAFATPAGQISDLVESEFGYHVIQVTEARGDGAPPFEQVRDRIVAQWSERQAAQRYSELAEQFRNLVYEQADTLEPAAKQFGLTVSKAERLSRTVAPGSSGPLANPRLHEQLFSEEALRSGRNIEAFETAPGVLVSARAVKHHPSRTQSFDEVKERVQAQWALDEAARLAREQGEQLLARLKGADEAARTAENGQFSPPSTVTRAVAGDLAPEAVAAAFAVPAASLPAYAGASLGQGGYQLILVEKAEGPAPEAESRRELYQRQYDRMVGQTAADLWVQDVLRQIDIERRLQN